METEKKEGIPAGTEGARRATGVPAGRTVPETGRWTSRAKLEVVLRLLRGEDLDAVSRELNVTAARLAEWRDTVLASGQAGLRRRGGDAAEDETARLRAKVGELTMANELLDVKIEKLESGLRPPARRSRP